MDAVQSGDLKLGSGSSRSQARAHVAESHDEAVKEGSVVKSLAALAQANRFTLVKLLIDAGQEGLRPKDIIEVLPIASNTLSYQLSLLTASGFLNEKKVGREVYYSVEAESVRHFIIDLMGELHVDQNDLGRPSASTDSRDSRSSRRSHAIP